MSSLSQYCLATEGSKVCGKWEGKKTGTVLQVS